MPSNKRSAVKHKYYSRSLIGVVFTACGLSAYPGDWLETRTKWSSVTCKNCLKTKGKK